MRKHTKRRVYGLINTMQFVKEGISPTPEADMNKLRARELSAIESIAKGKAGVAEWRDLTDMLNIAETMGRGGIGPEVLPVCEQAQTELIAAAKRFELTKRMGLTATGLTAIRELFAYHDAQRTAVTRGEYEKAISATRTRIRTHNGDVVDVMDATA